MARSKGILDNVDLDKDKGKGTMILVAIVIILIIICIFIAKPWQKDSTTPVQQGTEQTAPAPASQ